MPPVLLGDIRGVRFAAALTEATGASSREELAAFLRERTNAEIMQFASEKALPLAAVE